MNGARQDVSLDIKGLDDVIAALRGVAPNLRRRVLRNALAAGARVVRDEAKRLAPVISASDPMVQRGHRAPGTLRNAITVRTSKRDTRAGNVGVFVNVRPLKGAQVRAFKKATGRSGAKNPKDPFYWRFLEFGREARAAQSARRRVARVKRGGVEVVKGARARRALSAVGAIPPHRFLQGSTRKLGEALRKFESVIGPAVNKMNNAKVIRR